MYRCPKCQAVALTKQTRRKPGTGEVRRRYHCPNKTCLNRFTTIEQPVADDAAVKLDQALSVLKDD